MKKNNLWYKVSIFLPSENINEIFEALKKYGVNGFEENNRGIILYIPFYNITKEKIESILSSFREKINKYEISIFKNKDWSTEWRKFIKPVEVGNFYITYPEYDIKKNKINIIINPGNAFGVGTHETTKLMLDFIDKSNLEGKNVVDFGCGSGILTFAAAKKGAKNILSVDIDRDIYCNFIENLKNNKLENSNINLYLGKIENLYLPHKYDYLFINMLPQNFEKVNRTHLYNFLKTCSTIVYSGFLKGEREDIKNHFFSEFKLVDFSYLNEWGRMVLKL